MVLETTPDILALDFDGVICDGLIEYFQTAWRAYCQIWQPADQTPPDGLAEQFYPLRPVIETGWEMPVLLRSLLLGTADDAILQDWPAIAHDQITTDNVDKRALAQAVDGCRDHWIQTDLDHWLSQHRFYPGVLETLGRSLNSPTHTVIISTKESRFIHQLLQQQGVEMPKALIYGKDVKRPKYETLRLVIQQFQSTMPKSRGDRPTVVFIEDRLKALEAVAHQPDLDNVQLYLADWGYNTQADRGRVNQVSRHPKAGQDAHQNTPAQRIHLISLDDFTHRP